MIIMDPTSTNIPAPVDIDLKRLLRTSKLLAGYDNMPNAAYVNNALQQQQNQLNNGTLLDTNLVILGMGTFVSFSNNTAFDLNGNITVQNNPNPKPPQPPFNPGNPNNNNNNPPPPGGPMSSGLPGLPASHRRHHGAEPELHCGDRSAGDRLQQRHRRTADFAGTHLSRPGH